MAEPLSLLNVTIRECKNFLRKFEATLRSLQVQYRLPLQPRSLALRIARLANGVDEVLKNLDFPGQSVRIEVNSHAKMIHDRRLFPVDGEYGADEPAAPCHGNGEDGTPRAGYDRSYGRSQPGTG